MTKFSEEFRKCFTTHREMRLYEEADRWRQECLRLYTKAWIDRGHKDEQGNPCLPPDDPGHDGDSMDDFEINQLDRKWYEAGKELCSKK